MARLFAIIILITAAAWRSFGSPETISMELRASAPTLTRGCVRP